MRNNRTAAYIITVMYFLAVLPRLSLRWLHCPSCGASQPGKFRCRPVTGHSTVGYCLSSANGRGSHRRGTGRYMDLDVYFTAFHPDLEGI